MTQLEHDGHRAGRWWIAPLSAAALALLLFWPVVEHDFVYDGVQIITRDPRLHRLSFGLSVWVEQWWADGATVPISRPLPQFTYWLQTQLHGQAPLTVGGWTFNAFHLVDLLLFAVLCAFVSAGSRRLAIGSIALAGGSERAAERGGIAAAWGVGLGFSAQSLHTEVVASVVGRADTLALGFCLATILLWFRWRQRMSAGRAGVIGLLVLAAGLSKESGYLVAPMLGVIEVALRRVAGVRLWNLRDGGMWRAAVAIAVVVIVAVGQREAMKRSNEESWSTRPATLDNPLTDRGWGERVVTSFKLAGKAVQLMVWPVVADFSGNAPVPIRPLNAPDYSPRMLMPTKEWTSPLVLVGLGVIGAWGVLSVLAWRRRWAALAWLLILPIVWALPSNLVVLIGTIFAERLLMPLSLFVLLAGVMLIPWSSLSVVVRGGVWVIFGAWILVNSAMSFIYQAAWRDTSTLTTYMVGFHPQSGRFQGFFAGELALRGLANPVDQDKLFDEAQRRARKSIELWPEFGRPYEVLGMIAHLRGDERTAMQYLRYANRVTEFSPYMAEFEHQLGLIEYGPEQLRKRMAELEAAIKADPDNLALKRELARAYSMGKRHVKAVEMIEQLDLSAENDLGTLGLYVAPALWVGRLDLLVKIYDRQLELKPGQWSTMTDLGLILIESQNDLERGRELLERSIELSPGSAEPWAGLANYHVLKGDLPAALRAIDEAIRRAGPEDPKRAHYLRLKERLEKLG